MYIIIESIAEYFTIFSKHFIGFNAMTFQTGSGADHLSKATCIRGLIVNKLYWSLRDCHTRFLGVIFGMNGMNGLVWTRVSSETSFASKQPKLESKQVAALSKTKHLFRFFTKQRVSVFWLNQNKTKTNRNTDCRQLVVLISICELSIWNCQRL